MAETIAKTVQAQFESFLDRHDDEAWSAVVTTLLRSIHDVDKTATQIWFAFYPLTLFHALSRAEDPEKLARQLLLQGNYYLRDQIDSSHRFLYGHRYWAQVKTSVEEYAVSFNSAQVSSLADQILAQRRSGNVGDVLVLRQREHLILRQPT